MAYGIDYEGIYYTDHSRSDLGMLTTYTVSLDLADEKNFEIKAGEFAIPEDGWWYILNTEIGGIVDKYKSDSTEGTVTYTGRSFRGLLDSYIAYTYGETRILQGQINTVINSLLSECGINFFTCDAAETDSSIDVTVDSYTVTAGDTLYSAIIGACSSIDMTILIKFESDKIIHIIPILKQDYVDYLKYSGVDSVQFQISRDHALVNHLVLTSKDETGNFRRVDMFTDSYGTVQPYLISATPYEASDYILDSRNKVMTGLDEIAKWQECSDSPVDKYRAITSVPADWDSNYGNYYYQDTNTDSDGTVEVSYKEFEGVKNDIMTLTTSEPSDWATKYMDYYTTSYDKTTGKYTYSAVAGTSVIDKTRVTQITTQPFDWAYNYGQYYYKFNTGTADDYESYASGSKNQYVLMTSKPSDWNTNFTNYYRKVYKKKVTVHGKTTYKYIDTVSHKDAYYKACTATDDKKSGTIPSFSKRRHYRKDSITTIPKFDASNCYRCMTTLTAPAWAANQYYSGSKDKKAPEFDSANAYEKLKDHYQSMCEEGVKYFAELKADTIRAVTIDDMSANIGDTVGGTDKLTGQSAVAEVTNINITIEKGIVSTDYEIGG